MTAIERRLPRQPLRRLRLPLRRGAPARAAVLVPAGADGAQAGGARSPGGCRSGSARCRSTASRSRRSNARALMREVRTYVRRDRRAARRGPRHLVHRRRRDRQDDARDADLQGRDGGRPHGRDLLAAAAARAAARDLRRRRAVLAQRADRPAVRGRPAAHRRRRRRAELGVGARAALHDRQHALRGRQGARCSRPTSTSEALATQIGAAHRVAALRDLRRAAADARRRPARAAAHARRRSPRRTRTPSGRAPRRPGTDAP